MLLKAGQRGCSNKRLLCELSHVLCDGFACVARGHEGYFSFPGIFHLDRFVCLSLSCFLLEAAERRVIIFDKIFLLHFNSIYMRKVFLLAMTAVVLAGPAAFAAGGGKAKKQDCTHCTKQNCTGAKCAQCCSHGKCTKG
jgi:hypothetical protein